MNFPRITIEPAMDGLEMLVDLVFFEPDEHGTRPFDRFLSGPARSLPDHEQEIARRMGRGLLSNPAG